MLAGDYYHQQTESVPEQTWSSAGFISAATRGMLGIRVDSVSNKITFSPHVPPEWREVKIRNVRMQHAVLDINILRDEQSIRLGVANRGQSVSFVFEPQIPLGARLLGAQCGGNRVNSSLERHAQDEHVRLAFITLEATTDCSIQFRGGIEVIPPRTVPLPGNASNGIKITAVMLNDRALIVDADVDDEGSKSLKIRTRWLPLSVKGGTIRIIEKNLYTVEMDRGEITPDRFNYSHRRVVIHFSPIVQSED